MADNEGSSVGIVAVIGIIVLILIVGIFLYRSGGFGGRTTGGSINVQLPGGGTGGTGGTGGGGQ